MKSWFISDLHIKDTKERNGEILLRFLRFLNQNPKAHRLFLLGDIFDWWLSDGSAFVTHFRPIVDEIARLKKQGGEVYYFEGNHDFHIDVFWTKKFGIPVFENIEHFKIDGLNIRLEHGDFINPNDHKYLEYREFVRKKWMEAIGHKVPSIFMKWFGDRKSSQSRKRSSQYAEKNIGDLTQMIRGYAEETAKTDNYDVIITGHMHIRDDYRFSLNNKYRRSINLGSWLQEPAVLLLENGEFAFKNPSDLVSS